RDRSRSPTRPTNSTPSSRTTRNATASCSRTPASSRNSRDWKQMVGAESAGRPRLRVRQRRSHSRKSGRRHSMKVVGLGIVALLAASSAAFAQGAAQYPNQMVRIVVPFSAGSNTDGQARIIADKLTEIWKQQVIVENRPGVAGTASV